MWKVSTFSIAPNITKFAPTLKGRLFKVSILKFLFSIRLNTVENTGQILFTSIDIYSYHWVDFQKALRLFNVFFWVILGV